MFSFCLDRVHGIGFPGGAGDVRKRSGRVVRVTTRGSSRDSIVWISWIGEMSSRAGTQRDTSVVCRRGKWKVKGEDWRLEAGGWRLEAGWGKWKRRPAAWWGLGRVEPRMDTNSPGAAKPQPGGKSLLNHERHERHEKGLKSSQEATVWEESSTNRNRRVAGSVSLDSRVARGNNPKRCRSIQ